MNQAVGGKAGAGPAHWLNAERVRVYSWMIVAIFAAVLVVWIGLSLPQLVDARGKPLGYDFMAYWSAARLALGGRPEAAFDESVISAIQHAAVPFLPNIVFPWHYPPTFLLAIAPLGLLSYPAALGSFVLGTAALWAAFLRRVLPDPRSWIVAAAAPAGLINLLDGQNAFLTAALAGFALCWLKRRPVAAGVLIGLLAFKPHLGLLFPLALLAEGRWKTIVAASATVLALVAASLAAFGWVTWEVFLHHLALTQAMGQQGAVPWGTMPSPYVFALSLGLPVAAAAGLQGASALLAATAVWRSWRAPRAPFEAKAATLLAGSLLVSPYLFYYDLLWAALAAGWLALLGLRQGFARGEREILLFAWLAPALMQPVHAVTAVQLGFPAVLLLLVLAVHRAAPFSGAERVWLRRAVAALRDGCWINRRRLMRWGVALLAVSLAVLAWDVVSHTTAGVTNAAGEHLGRDFVNYWAGARLGASGRAAIAYDQAAFNAFEQSLVGTASELKLYSYPPTAMLLSWPLAWLPYFPAFLLWSAVGAGLCGIVLSRLAGWPAAIIATIGAPAGFLNLLSGQNGFFTAALLAGGLMTLERHPLLAGICFGGLVYKPHLAVLLPVALAAGRQWRTLAATMLTALALGAASLAVLGAPAWLGFVDQLPVQREVLEYAAKTWHRIPTVFAAFRLWGARPSVAYAAQIVSGVSAAFATAVIWRRPAPFAVKAGSLLVATFLATPYAWDYDAVVLIFAAAWFARAGLSTGFLPWERLAILGLLISPLLTMITASLLHLQLGPAVFWFVLALLLRRSHAVRAVGTEYRLSAAAASPLSRLGR